MDLPAGTLDQLVDLLSESKSESLKPTSSTESTSSGPPQPMAAAQTGSVIRKFGETGPSSKGWGGSQVEDSKSIWKDEEVLSMHEALSAPDGRKRPEFDFGYKQRVGSEDVFLGLSGTTESSVHCDTLVMRIFLPGERLADVDLDCTEERILVSSANL